MAGGGSINWHPLVADFIIAGRKLENLGLIHQEECSLVLMEDYIRELYN